MISEVAILFTSFRFPNGYCLSPFLSIEELVDAVEHTNLQFTPRLIF